MLRAIRSPLLSMVAELLADAFTPAHLSLIVQALMRSTDHAHVAELFAMVGPRSLRTRRPAAQI